VVSSKAPSNAFDDDGDTLADTDAHGAQSVSTAGSVKLVHGRDDKARTASAERMSERNGSAVRINPWVAGRHRAQ